ncbi:MAG: SIS domain-containing protein [Phycisphaerae bacterium]
MTDAFEIARKVIADEADALYRLNEMLDAPAFTKILDTIIDRCDQLIISGIGKSGNIAGKIAASLASTGTPATFMHPVEALHGDLGVVTQRHGLVAISRSGNTDELARFVLHFRRLGGPVIGMTQGVNSRLAELSDHLIALPDLPEAGPLSLAPTTSCILQLAAGDALAMALLHRRGFKDEDFASYHPEGSLGKRLLYRAQDLMHGGADLPLVPAENTFKELVLEMTRKQLGMALIVDNAEKLVGTFTDGDLRRIFERVENPRTISASEAHEKSRRAPSQGPRVAVSTVKPHHLAVDCLRIMREEQITALIVAEEERPIGILRLMDLIRAGIS